MCDGHVSIQKAESTQWDVERRSKATEQLGKNQKLMHYASGVGLSK